MDGRDLLSYFDADDDFYPIAVMTPNGLRVVEITNRENSVIYFEFPTTNPNDYRVGVEGPGIALVEPYESLLANDPPALVMPSLRPIPSEDPNYYEGNLAVVNAAGLLDEGGIEDILPWVYPNYLPIFSQQS